MRELKFGGGNRTFTVNETTEITFNPAARQFIDKFLDTMESCIKISEQTDTQKARVEKDRRAVFEIGKEQDEKISAEIDGLFGQGKAAALFPWGPTAWADGLPEWLCFCLTILDTIKEEVSKQKSQGSPRLAEYMEKYKEYLT